MKGRVIYPQAHRRYNSGLQTDAKQRIRGHNCGGLSRGSREIGSWRLTSKSRALRA